MAFPTSPTDGQIYKNKIYDSSRGLWRDIDYSSTSVHTPNLYIDNTDWDSDNEIRFREASSDDYGAYMKYGSGDILEIGTRSNTNVSALRINRGTTKVQVMGELRLGFVSRLSFYNYMNTTESQSTGIYLHLKTDSRVAAQDMMYSIEMKGHSYGQSKPISSSLVWYNYQGNIINIGTYGSHACSCYLSSDGYVVITIYFPYFYYVGFVMNQYYTATGLDPMNIISSSHSTISTGVY